MKIENMYHEMVMLIQRGIKEALYLETQGTIKLGSCNGMYSNPTFSIPAQKTDKENILSRVKYYLDDCLICNLGIVKEVKVSFKMVEGYSFGETDLNINIELTTDENYLKTQKDNKNILEVVKEYEFKTCKVELVK